MMWFKNLIRIPGKTFENLTRFDAADMIESYLSNGSEDYDACALPEFMLVPNRVSWLEELRLDLMFIDQSRRSMDNLDGLSSVDGHADLKIIVTNLRNS